MRDPLPSVLGERRLTVEGPGRGAAGKSVVVKLGWSVASAIAGLNGRPLIDAVVAQARCAAGAGLRSVHVGDKHGLTEPYAANLAIAARISGEVMVPLGILVLMPFWNPVILAEQLATLAATAARPLTVVAALGDGDTQFSSVGIPRPHRLGLFEEGLGVTRALLAGETVSRDVGPYSLRDARVSIRPPEPIRWWVAANAPAAIERAGRIADGWLASAKLTPREAQASLEIYRTATNGGGHAVIRRNLFIGDGPAEVDEWAAPVLARGPRGYPPESVLSGTSDEIAVHLSALADVGYDEVLGRSLVQRLPQTLDSIRRFGQLAVA